MCTDDSEEEGTSDLEQQDSIFSRLEELRFHLEQAMGFEHLIQAYNKIKVWMHMNEFAKTVTDLQISQTWSWFKF